MAAVARQVGERLRHERRQQAALLRHGVNHVAEEDRLVGRPQRIVVLEVELELPVGVLVVVGVVAPAEAVEVLRQLRDEVVRAGDALHVVAGLIERVEIVSEDDLSVPLLEQEELELHAHLQPVAQLGRPRIGVLEDRARAEVVRIAVDRDVAGEARQSRLEWHRGVRLRIRDRGDVRRGRGLADRAGGEASKAGAVVEQHVDALGRDELRARLAVHVDELGEEELDLVGLRSAAGLFFVLGLSHGHLLKLRVVKGMLNEPLVDGKGRILTTPDRPGRRG